jgi:type IV secretory pathway TrbD component
LVPARTRRRLIFFREQHDRLMAAATRTGVAHTGNLATNLRFFVKFHVSALYGLTISSVAVKT